jgi:hypothetical protein
MIPKFEGAGRGGRQAGFRQFLRYAEHMMRVVQFDIHLGVRSGLFSYDKVEDSIPRCCELRRRMRYVLERLELCEHKSVRLGMPRPAF